MADIQETGIVVSDRGVFFTSTSVEVMRDFSKTLKSNGCDAMTWSVAFAADGSLIVGLGGYTKAPPLAIEDKVMDVQFHWTTDSRGFEAIHSYCISLPWTGPTRLLPLKRPAP